MLVVSFYVLFAWLEGVVMGEGKEIACSREKVTSISDNIACKFGSYFELRKNRKEKDLIRSG